jgi:hypothetical protein
MRVRFIGNEAETASECTVYGLTFPRNEWVDLDEVPTKLLANPTFEVEEGHAPRRRKAEPDA